MNLYKLAQFISKFIKTRESEFYSYDNFSISYIMQLLKKMIGKIKT